MSDNKIIRITDDDVFSWVFDRDAQKPALLGLINAVLTDYGFVPMRRKR